MTRVFISYSHKDEDLRRQLEKSLKVLQRAGTIDIWQDRRLVPGSDLDASISEELELADLILLLVSPDFIASDYCYSREMARALEKRTENKAKVVPIILRPCAWKDTPLASLSGLPTDNLPVTKHATLDDAFLDILEGIKKVLAVSKPAPSLSSPLPISEQARHLRREAPRSSNLSIRKQFSDFERDSFLESGFEYIANYFDNSIRELTTRDTSVEGRFKRLDAQRFSAALYRGGNALSRCWISMGGNQSWGFSTGIRYSTSDQSNSFNEMLTVDSDGYSLAFGYLGLSTRRSKDSLLTTEGAAEILWGLFIDNLQ